MLSIHYFNLPVDFIPATMAFKTKWDPPNAINIKYNMASRIEKSHLEKPKTHINPKINNRQRAILMKNEGSRCFTRGRRWEKRALYTIVYGLPPWGVGAPRYKFASHLLTRSHVTRVRLCV